ncbi:unnamed protein product, partial [Ectocarpus sp. 6 AP-2014]
GAVGSDGVVTVGCGVAKSLLAGIVELWCLPASCLPLAGLAV